MLSDEQIKVIRDSIDLSKIISRNVKLQKRGNNLIGLCPFHNEKTPSFNVNDEEGFYHCFGCGAHGDVISFIRNFEGKSFIEALETIADIAGLKLPSNNLENENILNEKQSLLEITNLSSSFYSTTLFSKEGTNALKYIKSRGLDDETLNKFKIGYSPKYGLKKYLNDKGYNDDLIFKAGLLRKNSSNEIQEVFKGRLIFPIFDIKNNILGFGARALFNSKAKYINSPNSILFQKSQILYGISHLQREYLKDNPILIVEGYMDVISIFQSKIAQAVAPLGTSITENQIENIWKINKKPVLCLDGDIAGENAAWRFINKVLPIIKTGLEVTFAWLPKSKDPDQMVKNSKEEFEDIINKPQSLIDTIWNILQKKHDLTNPDTRALLWSEAKKTVNLINDLNLKQSYSDEVYKRISESRNKNINYINSTRSFASSNKIKKFIGKKNLLDAIFLILINHPKLALDYSEELVKIDFNNKNKNKILLILLDMIITNQDLDKIEFINYLKEKDLIESINNIGAKAIIKWIGYNPSDKTINEIKYNFSDLLNRKLNDRQRI
ncbi:DNA primase [SAR116 cluster bacterium]|nr:DNA primase [SAR116 cluster bacterium]